MEYISFLYLFCFWLIVCGFVVRICWFTFEFLSVCYKLLIVHRVRARQPKEEGGDSQELWDARTSPPSPLGFLSRALTFLTLSFPCYAIRGTKILSGFQNTRVAIRRRFIVQVGTMNLEVIGNVQSLKIGRV